MDTITQHMAPSRFNYIKFCYQAVTDAIECELDVHYNDPGSVQLVVNITSRPFADAQALYALGHRHFAEYNAYELIKMSSMLPEDCSWHYLGVVSEDVVVPLLAVPNLHSIETVDTQLAAQSLNMHRLARMRAYPSLPPLRIFLQVNTISHLSAGMHAPGLRDEHAIFTIANYIVKFCPGLWLCGLMTFGDTSKGYHSGENEDFRKLSVIGERVSRMLNRPLELSMGNNINYLEAIRQGSTSVLIDKTILGPL
ncbi:similar to Saccharomyces cerevisiae YBL036C Putative non-specific single-domain racemase based on structural similarity [Geotrichum candidum]|uniref:Similar to Saccharomyces cerevisiae YBL036C Putative non-specific single-domain racemase based on structural similarity n=1 Tax=Geotrichum candidum TaxID=1173061 RepID=A0A0J9X7Q1_GEOCN|nr:similar to Saccharomyces cerevisiae YBL036C Putative non-specific single-domain racemase based on structural similarity [Geotrichum candidum]